MQSISFSFFITLLFFCAGTALVVWRLVSNYYNKKVSLKLSSEGSEQLINSKLLLLDDVVSAMAHEINNSVSIITIRTEMLQRVIKDKNIILKELDSTTNLTIQTCERIITSLKNFKLITNHSSLETSSKKFLLKPIIDCVRIVFTHKAKYSDVKITFMEIDHNLIVYGNELAITQGLLSLLNIAYASVSNTKDSWIRFDCQQVGDFLKLSVTDSRVGLSKETAQGLIERSVNEGLGLSASRYLLGKFNGDLYYDTNSEKASFVVQIPMGTEQAKLRKSG